jgi:RNA polymerase sigma factor
MRDLDNAITEASNNIEKTESIVFQYKSFILKWASDFSKRYITQSDDEWAIALKAFMEAIKNYDIKKGSFLSFSELVIKRRLMDYYNSNKNYSREIPINPSVFNGECDEDEENLNIQFSIHDKISYMPDNRIKDEIEAINTVFAGYGFSFFDLIKCSPKANKTKQACIKAVTFICNNPIILNKIKSSKMIPIKTIEKNANVHRKILEHHRKYIIAVIEILSGEYPCLAEYMQPFREECGR